MSSCRARELAGAPARGPELLRAASPSVVQECLFLDGDDLETDLRRVLAGEVSPVFHFQPIADLHRAAVAGYEALVRFPVRAGLPPDVCLRAAGRFGFQIDLEAVIARSALQARASLPGNSFLCINVSPSFLLSAAWDGVLREQPDMTRIVVEITEEQSIADYDRIRSCAAAIKDKGGMVAIDDAGAGYASLKHILELRPAFIKLDRNFISDCDQDRAKSAVIEMMGAAASRMDAWIIAEGVETVSEMAELLRLGVPLAQGYFLGRPAPAMAELLSQARRDLQTRSARRATDEDLLPHAEPCAAVRTRAEAEQLLDAEAKCSVVAMTDPWGRPTALLERHLVDGVRWMPEVMRCQISSEVPETLRRALTRPPCSRFDPILLIDSEGQLRGIARVDRLMQAVLQSGCAPHKKPPARTRSAL